MRSNEYQLNQTETQMYRMKIPPKYLKVGLLCAALYEGTWHRAKIVDIMEYAVMVNIEICCIKINVMPFNRLSLTCIRFVRI